MKKNHSGFAHIFLLIIIVVIGIVGVGYFVFKNGQITIFLPNLSLSPTPTVFNQNTFLQIDTPENWGTYTNDTYGYKISYPTENKDFRVLGENSKHFVFYYPAIQNSYQVSIEVNVKQSRGDGIDGFVNRTFVTKDCCIIEPDYINFMGVKAKQATRDFPLGEKGYDLLFVNNDVDFHIEVTYGKLGYTEENQELVKKIISTFKFIDKYKEVLPDFSNKNEWLSFNTDFNTIPERNFRFKYPKYFILDNQDSGSVWLSTKRISYLSIEQTGSFKYASGDTYDLKLTNYFSQFNYSPVQHNNFTQIMNNEKIITYKFTVKNEAGCGGGVYDYPVWNCYISAIGDKGLSIAELKPVPEELIKDIINTVEFK